MDLRNTVANKKRMFTKRTKPAFLRFLTIFGSTVRSGDDKIARADHGNDGASLNLKAAGVCTDVADKQQLHHSYAEDTMMCHYGFVFTGQSGPLKQFDIRYYFWRPKWSSTAHRPRS